MNHEANAFSFGNRPGREEAAALLLEAIQLADDILDRAFKELSHARQTILFRRCIAQELAVQRQDIKLKRRAANARQTMIVTY